MSDFFNTIMDFFEWLLYSIIDSVLGGIAYLVELLPVPDFIANMPTITIPAGVAYFAGPANIPGGLAMIATAYGIRFLIRRLPFVG